MSESHSAYATGELVGWQIEELLRSELTNIRVPEDADLDEVIGDKEMHYIKLGFKDAKLILVYIESEEHAKQFESDGEYEIMYDTFKVYSRWYDEEAGPWATVHLRDEYRLSSIVQEKMHGWDRETHQQESPERPEMWREQIPEDSQPSEEDKMDRIELPSVFETG